MSLNLPTQQLLSDGTKWFAYSGVVQGDVSVPATITLIDIPNTGLRDSYVKILPYFAVPISSSGGTGLGIIVSIDDIEVYKAQTEQGNRWSPTIDGEICLFVPRQSKLTITSMNTTTNNTQERGANIHAWFL